MQILFALYNCFAGIALFLYMRFYLNGKSLIWSHDGVPQHLNSLAYYGRYLRKILHTLFIEHKLSIPMWDLNIGYGSDILTTLHYYVIGDPLTLLSVFSNHHRQNFCMNFWFFWESIWQELPSADMLFIIKIQNRLYSWDLWFMFCRMDDLCSHETSVLFESDDLSAIYTDGNW